MATRIWRASSIERGSLGMKPCDRSCATACQEVIKSVWDAAKTHDLLEEDQDLGERPVRERTLRSKKWADPLLQVAIEHEAVDVGRRVRATRFHNSVEIVEASRCRCRDADDTCVTTSQYCIRHGRHKTPLYSRETHRET